MSCMLFITMIDEMHLYWVTDISVGSEPGDFYLSISTDLKSRPCSGNNFV
jgi:hypothetical protein